MSDEEPIEAAIQPIGFLATLSSDWRISRVSANIGDYLDAGPEALIGQPVTSLFSPAAIHSLRNRLALLRGPDATERLFSIPLTDDARHYDVAVHMRGDQAVVEAERNHDHHHDRESTGTVRGMIASLGEAGSMSEFFAEAARQLRALTGYDRVTIHRFDADGADDVVGEVLRSGIASAMGKQLPLQPASDGSASSLLSLIADIDAAPVSVIPPLDRRGRRADLSRAVLRAAPPADLDRLRSIGVHAALSIALIVAGRPWGLIACHHHAPCCPSFERRSAVEYYAIMLAMQIEIRELKAKLGA